MFIKSAYMNFIWYLTKLENNQPEDLVNNFI